MLWILIGSIYGLTFFVLLEKLRRVKRRLRLMESWLAEEKQAEERLLELDPEFAARLGIKKKKRWDEPGLATEWRSGWGANTMLAQALSQQGLVQEIEQSLEYGLQQRQSQQGLAQGLQQQQFQGMLGNLNPFRGLL